MKNKIIIFENQGVKLEVNMKDETVWITQEIAQLFNRARSVITRHINNIFKIKELEKDEVCAKFAQPKRKKYNYRLNNKFLKLVKYDILNS